MEVAIVTGAGSGIGRATAIELVLQGYRVYALDKNEKLIVNNGDDNNIIPIICDVLNEKDISSFFSYFSSQEKHLDLLFNGVGAMKLGGVLDTSEEDWDFGFHINLKSALVFSKRASNFLLKSKNPSIINISSVLGETYEEKSAIYTVMKSALVTLTKCLAKELAPKKIRVNAISPGPIQTSFVRSFCQDTKKIPGASKLVMKLAQTPIGRTGKAEEVAKLVAYLASPQASFITGSCISIDGGWSL
ncbi:MULTISPECIES: SDR family NAD(P)-dependent oxidoreductase [Bacillus]|uniref:Oxidoreductase, short chain dehydrogenase/reductase n=1 Tax=Bacillus anthracis TaxID=1392 RepID=A0A2A7D266_BACAN|nr:MULTISPECIES: SDR family oxidoreductase [Bacillus]MCP1166698.1 SDR family oxidoreductase [Bacillus sp. 1813sda1]MDC7973073.1 SDR family NAD(P)-dependent oxidoreductase [Bacillus sp. BLCC-B18]MED2795828.1 SDR family NAD(P)-dependent oxidoreductase [Bacillus wiedmannii]PDZ14113.1 oxidoreductase, short chain dehydrogenase/reductase [Bacillus anthracis]PDZ48328.1 oxidoreductase, short chain dehydrogenase/reductase [Bacillus sp. AFS094611]